MKTYCIQTLVFLIFIATMASAQNTVLYYDVIHNDKVVGNTVVKKMGNDQNFNITLHFSADINLLIKRVVIKGKEHARYENGILQYGSIFRQANDKIKTDKSIKRLGSFYTVHDGNQSRTVGLGEIHDNMLSLLFNEPQKVNAIYSDNQQKLVNVKESSPHQYIIPGKDESSSTYIFQNGQCSRIIIKSDLLTLQLVRK